MILLIVLALMLLYQIMFIKKRKKPIEKINKKIKILKKYVYICENVMCKYYYNFVM